MSPKVSRRYRHKPRLAPVLHAPARDATQACHDALRSEPFWSNLRLVGFMPDATSDADVLELRRCPQCGSSIAKKVPRLSVYETLHDVCGVVDRSLDALASNASTSPRRRQSKGNGHA